MVRIALIPVLVASAAASIHRHVPRQTTQAPASTTAPEPEVTAISECHLHESAVFCFVGTDEYSVAVTPTATGDVPAQYTGCHSHGAELFCVDANGNDVEVHSASETEEGHNHEGETTEDTTAGQNCHYHGNVLHCDDDGASAAASGACLGTQNEYNIGLRVGLLFAILVTSAIGVFGPIFLSFVMPNKLNLVMLVLKQFGTGIIISTAFVHLFTHAAMMFGNDCIGSLNYEGTTAAIVMAGLFLSFLVEYAGQRVVKHQARVKASTLLSTEVVGILVMEAGIVFHSILIGLTLVVTPDDGFIPLFVVILFHQMFEGIALGSRIAAVRVPVLPNATPSPVSGTEGEKSGTDAAVVSDTESAELKTIPLPLWRKISLAGAFSLITPLGMAIGIGVLDHFNSNDRETLIAIGTLDALSAGILIWVGVVEMWAGDWMAGGHAHGHGQGHGGELAEAGLGTVALGMFGLVAGLALMSLLGKWA